MTEEKTMQEDTTEEESFAELFARSYTDPGRLEPGQKVTAKVLSISGDWVFIDTGRKGEGVLDRKELVDGEGNLAVAIGDSVTAWFVSASGTEFRFTTKVGGSGGAATTGGTTGAAGATTATGVFNNICGKLPSVMIGGAERPQPNDRSAPNPESASRRSAALSGAAHLSRASSLENTAANHNPASGANSRQAVEMA